MIHEIHATTGEITRTWDTGTYWINHQAYIAETVLRSPDGDHLVIASAYEDEAAYQAVIAAHDLTTRR